MPKHLHILRPNAYHIPVGTTAIVTTTEAHIMIADGTAIEIPPPPPLPTVVQEAPPTIIVQEAPKPKTATRKRKAGPMKTPKFSNSLKSNKS